MKTYGVALGLLLLAGPCMSAEQTVEPDVRTPIKVSNRDVNRFVRPGGMQDMIYSKEKDITGHFARSDAFVKFRIKKIGEELEYATQESELYLVCDGSVYNIITQPSDIPAVTVRLTPARGESFKDNLELFRDMPLEKVALHIIREAYGETYPSSYTITPVGADEEKIAIKPGFIEAKLTHNVDVEGVGLRLKTFEVNSLSHENQGLSETDFLRSDISDSLLAIAVENHNLQPDQATRVFVVEKREAH